MICYRGVRYHHLEEQNLAKRKPESAKELFNLRHPSPRNAVKRIFGIDKRRFKVLTSTPKYDFQTQTRLVFALTALHDIIKDHSSEEVDYFEGEEESAQYPPTSDFGLLGGSLATSIGMNEKRDRIPTWMWMDYIDILSRRGTAVLMAVYKCSKLQFLAFCSSSQAEISQCSCHSPSRLKNICALVSFKNTFKAKGMSSFFVLP